TITSAPAGMELTGQSSSGSETSVTISWTPTAAQVGEHSVTIQISDGIESLDSSYTVTVLEPLPPYFTNFPADISIEIEEEYIRVLEGESPEGSDVIYSLASGPSGMTVDSTTGELTWIPVASQIGEHQIVVEISDGNSSPDSSYTITVLSPSLANTPVTKTIPDIGSKTYFYFSGNFGLNLKFLLGNVSGKTIEATTYETNPPLPPESHLSKALVYIDINTTVTGDFETELEFSYTDEQLANAGITNEDSLTLAHYDVDLGRFKGISSVIDKENNKISAIVNKFSIWTITDYSSVNSPPQITRFPKDTVFVEAGKIYSDTVSAFDEETPDNVRYMLVAPPAGMTMGAVSGIINW
ncbi:cadherin repeat domain-containing protein, partial [bacterium]|nr:cadherin repeat domain-containing protein [bacterium]